LFSCTSLIRSAKARRCQRFVNGEEVNVPGPYVSTAVFCEKALQEVDGVTSLIRVIDRISMTIAR